MKDLIETNAAAYKRLVTQLQRLTKTMVRDRLAVQPRVHKQVVDRACEQVRLMLPLWLTAWNPAKGDFYPYACKCVGGAIHQAVADVRCKPAPTRLRAAPND